MISVDEALARILSWCNPLEPEKQPILEAVDRVLAEDITATEDLPPFASSAVDGYALRAAETQGATKINPLRLRVIGSVAAGHFENITLRQGRAVRIMTGAPLPAGADAVVPFEDTSDGQQSRQERLNQPAAVIEVYRPFSSGENVRPAGRDVRRGELVLSRDTVLQPWTIAVLASLGRSSVTVTRRPRVAILATGDELVPVDQPLPPGKIRSSNEYSLAALVAHYGGIPIRLGIAGDALPHLVDKVREGLAVRPDLFLSTGGVAAGDYDLVRTVLNREGEVLFDHVNMRPGKSLTFGILYAGERENPVPFIALPGNPTAALIAFEVFVRPAILKMQGYSSLAPPTIEAVLEDEICGGTEREYVCVSLERHGNTFYARPVRRQESSRLIAIAQTDGLAVIPEGVPRRPQGTRVSVIVWDRPRRLVEALD